MAGWYPPANVWRKRVAISVPKTAAAVSVDIDIPIPAMWDDFWDTIDNSGNELRVVHPLGGLASYLVDNGSGGAFNKGARSGRIRMDAVPLPNVADMCMVMWLLYGSSTPQGSLGVGPGPGPGTPDTGYIELGGIGPNLFAHQSGVPGSDKPRYNISKRVNEYLTLWVDYRGAMGPSALGPQYGVQIYEDPWYATYSVLDTAGAVVGSMDDPLRMRWVYTDTGMYLKVPVQAGADGNLYTAVADTRTKVNDLLAGVTSTTFNQRLQTAIGVRVKDTRH